MTSQPLLPQKLLYRADKGLGLFKEGQMPASLEYDKSGSASGAGQSWGAGNLVFGLHAFHTPCTARLAWRKSVTTRSGSG
jgi:hypothetical protein